MSKYKCRVLINISLLVYPEVMSLTDDYNIPLKQTLVTFKTIYLPFYIYLSKFV